MRFAWRLGSGHDAARMNYYEHHLGDYDGATAHLSWLEDCAYRRLICLYYRTEAPIPADMKQACRLVRASARQEREAVEQVLREFFELRDDGWHNARCDADIEAYHEAEPDRIAKRENAKERQRRARERRRELFDALRRHDHVPAWDTPTKMLESLLQQCESRATTTPVTPPVTEPVTRDDTATHTHFPPPTTHIPPSEEKKAGAVPAQAPPPPPAAPGPFSGESDIERLNGRHVVELSPTWELPTTWGIDAEALGWKPSDVLRESERFRQYWATGKGAGTRRGVKGWRQAWSNWLAKAERMQR